ncbi:hypothetical protein HYW72_00150 [Candidatus Nomurabacteria bacterium]|nr:hypothetical protein [Candidatus Nomurabacteria bacterium]
MKSEIRQCQNCKKDFVIEPDDFGFYEKMKVPPPTFCPLCRIERRAAFRNERKLFKVKDIFTHQNIFSLYPDEAGNSSTTEKEWFGDNFDAMEYARKYDFSKPFFEQFFELKKEVPVFSLRVEFMVNSPYSANATALKNSYLCFNSNNSEDCMYGNATDFSKDCVDNSHINQSERCYECFWLRHCYQCYFTIMSADSRNLWFCRDCLGCNDCFGCANLRKASYCIFNKQYPKKDYFEEIKKMNLQSNSGVKKAREKARSFWQTQIIRFQQGVKNLNSTGSYVTDCRNVNDSFLMREGENIKYSQYLQVPKNKDCYDAFAWGANMELHYETCLSGGNSFDLKFCDNCWPNCRSLEYCAHLFSSSDCFGCVGLKKKQYCILNKQYVKDEYFEMVKKIKKQMDKVPYVDKKGNVYKYGEFFPIEHSQFGYNNTTAIQYFPMTKEEADKNGYPWIEVSRGEYAITKKASELPDSINDVDKRILEEVIECKKCQNPYRILENEFLFYQKENFPLPTMCNDCRFERRISDRLKFQLYKRSCMCAGEADTTKQYKNTVKHIHGNEPCAEEFKTGYASDRPEIVYCEKCYQQEVY